MVKSNENQFKVYKIQIIIRKRGKITDQGDENVRLSDCEFYLNKFSKAILVLSFSLEKKRNPGLSKELLVDKQKKFIMNRLSKLCLQEDVRKKVLEVVVLRESYL